MDIHFKPLPGKSQNLLIYIVGCGVGLVDGKALKPMCVTTNEEEFVVNPQKV